MDLADPPTTLEDWYKWALKFDNNFHRLQRILKRDTAKKEEAKPTGKWTFKPRKDPNAMDVDSITQSINAMTAEEQMDFMKKGLCFRCKKPRHISRDCPEKKGTPTGTTSTTTATPQKKMTPKELVMHIRTFTASMDDKEKEEFFEAAEEEGF